MDGIVKTPVSYLAAIEWVSQKLKIKEAKVASTIFIREDFPAPKTINGIRIYCLDKIKNWYYKKELPAIRQKNAEKQAKKVKALKRKIGKVAPKVESPQKGGCGKFDSYPLPPNQNG